MPLNLTTKYIDHVYIIHCAGSIVMGDEAKALETTLERCSIASTQLVLNVAEVHRLDSMGLGLLVRYMTSLRKRNGDLRLAASSSFVTNLLSLTMLSTVFLSYPTDQAALQSFLKKPAAQTIREKRGHRVLLIDSSPDLCAFIRTVLAQYGFDIKSTGMLRDAKVILRNDAVDYILIGPSNAHATPDILAQHLGPAASKAITRRLSEDFKTRHAHEAPETLLKLFNITPSPQANA
jgi:anti-sigma B factor antagonist